MPKHRARRSTFRPSLPHVRVRGVVAVSVSLVSLSVAALATGLWVTAGAGSPADAVVVAAQRLPVPSAPPEVVEPEPAPTLEPPAVLVETDDAPAADPVSREVTPTPDQGIEEIPEVAQAAYQRAEAVLNDARAGCRVEWTLLAAVGRVESDHGRVDGGVLDDEGLVTPALHGAALNGKQGREKVRDTDGGRLDGQRTWDRRSGPLNFLPTTWSVVGVDADDDGRRDPQDIDDAALAAGVLLCSVDRDLTRAPALRAALGRLNPAAGYVRLVRAAARTYATDVRALENAEPTVPVVVENPAVPAPDDEKDEEKDEKDEEKDEPKDEAKDEAKDDEKDRDVAEQLVGATRGRG